MTEPMTEDEKRKYIRLLRSLANDLEEGKNTVAIVAAWVLQVDENTLTHNAFYIQQHLHTGVQLNTWRAEASRLMRLMDQVESKISENSRPVTMQ